jgi:peptidoglycan/LPS O-acetylase OafA/YrhL
MKASPNGTKPSDPLRWLISGIRADSPSPYLDGLRGIAVLYVIIGHYTIYDASGFAQKILGWSGIYGVYLFFLLSSFLLTGILVKALRSRGLRKALLPYLRRRFLRIYPMFAATLAVIYFVPDYYAGMFADLTPPWYTQLFLIWPRGVFWAISVEIEFYLVLPVIVAAFVYAPRARVALMIGLLMIALAQLAVRYLYPDMFPNGYPHLLPYLHIFLIGTALAFSRVLVEDGRLPSPATWLANGALIIGIAGQIWCVPAVAYFTREPFVMRDAAINTLFWSCVFFALVYGSEQPRRWLSSPVLRWIGIVSFSAYLTHILVFRQIAGSLITLAGFYATGVICLAVTLALSTLTFVVIERPLLRDLSLGVWKSPKANARSGL